jgi:CheY-specific phosphatase CheX
MADNAAFIFGEAPIMAGSKENPGGKELKTVYGTEDILIGLCDSVVKVLSVATQSPLRYSGMAQKINKTSLKPDVGCFVLFDGGFSGLVVLNFSAGAAMEIYDRYMTSMGMPREELASSCASDEVCNAMGELMNQVVGDFTGKVSRRLQTHITQNQPKMLALNKQVVLSVDANLDQPQARRVTFYTKQNNIFYLEMAIDRTEFIQIAEFDADEAGTDEVFSKAREAQGQGGAEAPASPPQQDEAAALLASLGM